LPVFHLFGFVTELASTFQPPLSAFQFAFTAQSSYVRDTIHTTILRILSGVNLMWDLEVRKHRAPIQIFFEQPYLLLQRACSMRF
jgi:hypothetical protein